MQNCLKWLESLDLRAMVWGYYSIVCLVVRHLGSGIRLPGIFCIQVIPFASHMMGFRTWVPSRIVPWLFIFLKPKQLGQNWCCPSYYFYCRLLLLATINISLFSTTNGMVSALTTITSMSTVFCPDNRSLIRWCVFFILINDFSRKKITCNWSL